MTQNNFVLAVAYGEGSYDSCTYDNCQATTQVDGSAGTPNTGLLQEPVILIPVLVLLAVVIVAAEMVVRKLWRKRRTARLAAQ